MHHNRSLLPDVEVLLGVMVKTSRCNIKLLFVILNFYSWFFFVIILTKYRNFNQISEFQPNFRMLIKFPNFNQTSKFQPHFGISTRFVNFYQIYECLPNFSWSMTVPAQISKSFEKQFQSSMLPHQTFRNCQRRRLWATLLWSGSGDAAEIFGSQRERRPYLDPAAM